MSQVSIKLTPRDNVGLPYAPSNNANTILLFQQFFKGDQGIQGIQGKSAYQVWLDDGHTGTPEDFINDIDPNLINAALDAISARNAIVKPTISSNFGDNKHELYEVPTGNVSKLLTDIWMVTRGSSATIQDACGLDRTVSANVPRITYDILGRASLLVEEARIRINTHPRDAWKQIMIGTGTGVNPLYLGKFDNGKGQISADRFILNKGAGNISSDASGIDFGNATVTGQPASARFRIKSATNDTYIIRADFNGQAPTSGNLGNISVTPEWKEFTGSISSAIDTARKFMLRLRGTLATSDYADILIDYVQTEQATDASSFIPDATIFNSRASPKYVPDATGALVQVLTDVKAMAYNPANLNAEPVALYEVASTNLLANRDTMATETVTVVNGQTYTLSFDGTGTVQLSGANATNVIGLGAGLANQKSFTFVASSTSLTLTVTGSCLRGQLENLPYATSRIPNAMVSGVRAADVTTGVQAARAAETIKRTLGKEFNKSEGSIYFEATVFETGGIKGLLSIDDGLTSGKGVHIRTQSGTVRVYANGAQIISTSFSPVNGVKAKYLLVYTKTTLALFINGVNYSSALASPIRDMSVLSLNVFDNAPIRTGNATYRGDLVYPKALPDAQAIALTS